MKVEVLDIPIRYNGSLYKKGESFSVNEKDYNHIKDHVSIVQEARKKGGDASERKGN